jgi:hypothetical protein
VRVGLAGHGAAFSASTPFAVRAKK